MNIALHYSNNPPFVLTDHEQKGLGGTENFACYVAKELAAVGHQVSFYNRADIPPTDIQGIRWANLEHFDPLEPRDALISFRMREVFQTPLAASLKVLILADTESEGLGDDVRDGRINTVMPVSKWQKERIAGMESIPTSDPCWLLGSNGIDINEFPLDKYPKQPGKCIHLSTPERGLALLLDAWPSIQNAGVLKEKGIQPELHLFSSFMGWGVSAEENDKMCAGVYGQIDDMIAGGMRIVNHKHAARDELRQHQLTADLLLYRTNFLETYCISLTECMAAGVIPIISNKGAMPERVFSGSSGYVVGDPEDDAASIKHRQQFIQAAVTAMWVPEKSKDSIRQQARIVAERHHYPTLIHQWAGAWEARLKERASA